ncbi:hypothetical protein D9M68_832530 [compost metagenome]
MSGLAERALLADSSGSATAVIEAGRVAAAQDTEHAADRGAVGANQPSIALVGGLAAFQQLAEFVAAFEQVSANGGAFGQLLQPGAVGAEA